MKVVAISDTHMRHHDVQLPEGDLLLHAGDITSCGILEEALDFLAWFTEQPHPNKILIAGNHDFVFERNRPEILKLIPNNITYLENEGVEIDGIKIWGSPVQPTFYDWAFNVNRGAAIKKYWDLIPNDTDVLITHGPPYGILDRTVSYKSVGCEELLIAVERVKPKVHLFGHIHEAHGNYNDGNTTFVNASILNEKYIYTNDPFTFEI